MAFCWKCGKEMPDGQTFCSNCGADLRQGQAQNQGGAPTPGGTPAYGQPAGGYNQAAGGYNQPAGNYNQPSGGGYGTGRLQTDRSLVMYILLSLVTCGIYSYYFIYKLAQDVNIACDGDGKQTGGLGMFILLSFLTCGIYAIYWYYSLGNRLAENAPRYGLHFQENGTTVLMWYLIGFLLCGIGPYVAMHFLIRNTNAICSAYNQYNNL